jgi:hypothetical protein
MHSYRPTTTTTPLSAYVTRRLFSPCSPYVVYVLYLMDVSWSDSMVRPLVSTVYKYDRSTCREALLRNVA